MNISSKEFEEKFSQLNDENKKYVIAIQQALAFAQENESKQAG